jgi:hypothetical protein
MLLAQLLYEIILHVFSIYAVHSRFLYRNARYSAIETIGEVLRVGEGALRRIIFDLSNKIVTIATEPDRLLKVPCFCIRMSAILGPRNVYVLKFLSSSFNGS